MMTKNGQFQYANIYIVILVLRIVTMKKMEMKKMKSRTLNQNKILNL